jgi:hypothetical protein
MYADLLSKAVTVGKEVEKQIFDRNEEAWLTTVLDKNILAGGKLGTLLYLFMAFILFAVAVGFSTYCFYRWRQPHIACLLFSIVPIVLMI